MDFDYPTSKIASFATTITAKDLSDASITAVVSHHFDSIGCAIGALDSEPARIARALARTVILPSGGCSVFGIEQLIAPEQAVFANVSMVRQLDFNDFFAGGERGGHLSDMIAAIVAAAELCGATGKDLVRGIYVAYEVFAGLSAAYPLRANGWDHSGTLTAIGTAAGAGAVFGSDFVEIANSISMALTPSVALVCTRAGEVSHWKGCASAHGAMTGFFAARLGHAGMTGPKEPFEGIGGLNEKVAPESDLSMGGQPSAVERSSFKQYAAVGATQSIISPLIGMRDQFELADIEQIIVETYDEAWRITGGGNNDQEEKWNPKTPETADHSMPYIISVSLMDGEVIPASYSPERIADPALLALRKKISIRPRDDLTALYPLERKTEVRIQLSSGKEIKAESANPIDREKSRLTNDQLSTKFNAMCSKVIGEKATSDLEAILWRLPELSDLDELTKHYRAISVPESKA